jgi:hypothetical protein
MKPGYKTSEFWTTLGVQVTGLAVILGFVNGADVTRITDGWSQCVTAIFTILAQAAAAFHYLKARTDLKLISSSDPSKPSSGSPTIPPLAALLALGLLWAGATPAMAQSKAPAPPPYVLAWRAWVHQQLTTSNAPQATDPALVTMFQLHLQQQREIIALLQQQQRAAPQASPAPQPLGPIAYQSPFPLAPPVPPQAFPLAPPAPPQAFPLAPPAPPQAFPLAPPAPPQPLPLVAPAPPQVLPSAPPQAPQALPLAPPVPAAPSGYMRFTRAIQ